MHTLKTIPPVDQNTGIPGKARRVAGDVEHFRHLGFGQRFRLGRREAQSYGREQHRFLVVNAVVVQIESIFHAE